jgi:tRNA (guanine37-N1)-methyltransferase
MKISILTLFPEMFQGPFDHSIVKKAQEKGRIEIQFVNIRDFGLGNHKMVDDTPYGGGIGMVLRPDVLYEALQHTKASTSQSDKQATILLSASGETYTQKKALQFTTLDHLILICGHYEGVDERIKQWIDAEISIGDFVVTGGEIPAMLIADSVARLIPGVLKEGATQNESFSLSNGTDDTYLEYPQYTKPQEFKGMKVPDVLLSGDHARINQWRLEKAKHKTQTVRPDLLKSTTG